MCIRDRYDASQPALQRLLTEGDNNSLIPVDKWMAFGEKGGLKGAIDLLPIDTLAAALNQCYQARSDIKAQIYEITGISDIIRGASYASETATAQQIKGQYAGLRLRAMQEDVALFASELIRLKAQIMCAKFQPQTILAYAAAGQMQPADQQLIPQALQLLRDKPLRNFRVEVAADTLVQLDEQQMKQDRMEFLQAFGGFVQQAMPVVQASPQMAPMMMEIMKFGVGAFKQAKQLEGVLDQALQQYQNGQQQEQKPDPEAMKVQAEQQLEQAKLQSEMQLEQAKMQANMQLEQMKEQFQAQENQRKEELERWKAELDTETKVLIARISANPGMDVAKIEDQNEVINRVMQSVNGLVADSVNRMAAMHSDMANMHQNSLNHIGSVMEVLKAPKRIVRGPDGRAAGVEIVNPTKTV
jgi:F0F1-type ATP synthase membrane subunit b/b'